jgi:hypothetical protein
MRNVGPAFFNNSVSYPATVTLNPSDKDAGITLSGGNLTATKNTAAALKSVRATLGRAHTDNGYFEVYVTDPGTNPSGGAAPFALVGLSTASMPTSIGCGSDANSWGYYEDTGEKFTNNVATAYGTSWKVAADVVQVALNNGKIWFGKNGTWQNGGNPAAGTGEAFSGLTGTLYPTISLYKAPTNPHIVVARFHPGALAYAPPSGFGPWDR